MEQKKLRDSLQQGIYKVINPFVKFLIRLGLTPNAVTLIGLVLNIGVTVIFIEGAEQGHRGDFSYVGWAGGLVLFAGLFDMLDGQVARLGKMSSTFGALFDSVLDRYSELILFLGICYYLVAQHYFLSSLFAFLAMIGSLMVSYVRARAEGLGVECKGGLMQRPERVVLIGVSAIACGLLAPVLGDDFKLSVPGISFHIFETMSIFTIPITVMAVMTNITAINRMRDAKKALDAKEKANAMAFSPKNTAAVLLLLVSLFATTAAKAEKRNPIITDGVAFNEVDTFPVPKNEKNMMFYVQRTPNTNTIVYSLRLDENGKLIEDDPMHIFWIRYQEENAERKDLNYIQRKFAYGLKIEDLGNEKWRLKFVAYDKHPLYLMKAPNNSYHVYTMINNKQSILSRIYIRIDEGGTFWAPNVRYIELKGTDATTGKENIERIKIK